MRLRLWIIGLATGIAVGATVATVMTYLDWRLNPGGIFHNAGQTNWVIVRETASSWFWPVAALVAGGVLLTLFIMSRRR